MYPVPRSQKSCARYEYQVPNRMFHKTLLTLMCHSAERADAPFTKVVVEGRLITGQNPDSARGVGEEVIKALGL